MGRASRRSLYSIHPGVEMVRTWVAGLPEKTGRSLEEWIAIAHRIPIARLDEIDDEVARWLKTAYEPYAVSGRA